MCWKKIKTGAQASPLALQSIEKLFVDGFPKNIALIDKGNNFQKKLQEIL